MKLCEISHRVSGFLNANKLTQECLKAGDAKVVGTDLIVARPVGGAVQELRLSFKTNVLARQAHGVLQNGQGVVFFNPAYNYASAPAPAPTVVAA